MAGYEDKLSGLEKLDTRLVAMSADSGEDARKTVRELELSFPVGHGLDVDQAASKTGAYANEDPPHLQPADFILRPDGTVALAVYSSGAVGRLRVEDAIDQVEFLQD